MHALVKVTWTAAPLLFWIDPIQPDPSVVGADFVMKTFAPALAPLVSHPPPTTTFPAGHKRVAVARVEVGRSADELPTS